MLAQAARIPLPAHYSEIAHVGPNPAGVAEVSDGDASQGTIQDSQERPAAGQNRQVLQRHHLVIAETRRADCDCLELFRPLVGGQKAQDSIR
jgi:hypothetical protein